jgi:hypothetical protein
VALVAPLVGCVCLPDSAKSGRISSVACVCVSVYRPISPRKVEPSVGRSNNNSPDCSALHFASSSLQNNTIIDPARSLSAQGPLFRFNHRSDYSRGPIRDADRFSRTLGTFNIAIKVVQSTVEVNLNHKVALNLFLGPSPNVWFGVFFSIFSQSITDGAGFAGGPNIGRL